MPVSARRLASTLENWFARHQRPLPWRVTCEPYQVWVSEVMLQQTRMNVVLRYFEPFIGRFPSVAALASATEEEVLAAWSGLGYYRRARMLHAGAREVAARFGGELPYEVETLMTIPGIGRYTAGAIASIAFGVRAPIVDGNVARVVARLTGHDAPVSSPQLMRASWKEAERLVTSAADARAFNQGLMELGALVCTPRAPVCEDCPLRRYCAAYATGAPQRFPARRGKRSARRVVVPLYLIEDSRGRILMRLESGALMSSMYHLPHGSTELLSGPTLQVVARDLIGSFRHTITTRSVEFRLHAAEVRGSLADRGEYRWVDPAGMAGVPHPSYVAKAIALVRLRNG